MGSSSDESFAWTNASDSSESSIDQNKIVQHKMTGNGLDDDSDYGINYKKKLHKKLFLKNELTDESDHELKIKMEKRAKRKQADDELESPKKKKIKLEPESDKDIPKKKKKKNSDSAQIDKSHSNESNENISEAYNNLDIRVKEEQDLEKPKNKLKRNKNLDTSWHAKDDVHNLDSSVTKHENETEFRETNCSLGSDEGYSEKKKKKKNVSQIDESYDNISNQGMSQDYSSLDITMKKEKHLESQPSLPTKSKKHKRSTQLDKSISLNDEMAHNLVDNIKQDVNDASSVGNEESYTTKKKKKRKSKKRDDSLYDDNNPGTEDMEIDRNDENDISYVKSDKSKQKQEIENNDRTSEMSDKLDEDAISSLNKSNDKLTSPKNVLNSTSEIPEKSNKRMSRISDRIHFQETISTQMDTSINNQLDNVSSRKLKKFLKINRNLTEIPFREQEWTLSGNNEIWAIRCPQNIDSNSLQGTNIKLDGKCKIKVDNQTYIGSMNKESSSITVLSSEHNIYVIKKIPLCGILNLHRKVPKVHIPDNNIIDNNQTDFVPLPETKNRHPLFGTNYKKAIKLPSAVAERLNEAYMVTEPVKKNKKKKHKRDKDNTIDVDNSQVEETHEAVAENDKNITISSKKKNRKRKHATEEEHASNKRVKHDADSSTVWESEQAIEENLFNF